MTKSNISERLARYYAEAVIKNPKDTIYENMDFAVSAVPIVAAAPELLEALKDFTLSKDYPGMTETERQMHAKARAAIAKATGGQK